MYFGPKLGFFVKIRIFRQNSDFSSKFGFFVKIRIFRQNSDFSPKFRYFVKIFIFRQFGFLSIFLFFAKISIFCEKFDFYFSPKFRFFAKSSIFICHQNFDFSRKVPFLVKFFSFIVSIFRIKKFDFSITMSLFFILNSKLNHVEYPYKIPFLTKLMLSTILYGSKVYLNGEYIE